MKHINVAVAGCGYWGPNLIRNLTSLPDCRVKWVCDIDRVRIAHMKQMFPGVDTTQDFDVLVNDPEIDAILIATPIHLHHEMGKKSLLAGKHTMIEKPMASSAKECLEFLELSTRNRLVLMVGHTFIYSSPVRRIKEIIDSGDIGTVQYISSRRLNLGLFQKDINVTWDLAPHDISIILYLLGKGPVAVNCQGKANVNKGIEDVTNMSLDFADGGFATIHSSWLDPNKVREMIIVGSKRMVVYNDNEPLEKIKIYDKRVEIPPHYDTFAEFHYSYHYGDMYAPYIKQTEPLKVECQHFLDCIRAGARPLTSGVEGLQVVQILEASTRSLKSGGGRVEIDRLTAEILSPASGPAAPLKG